MKLTATVIKTEAESSRNVLSGVMVPLNKLTGSGVVGNRGDLIAPRVDRARGY